MLKRIGCIVEFRPALGQFAGKMRKLCKRLIQRIAKRLRLGLFLLRNRLLGRNRQPQLFHIPLQGFDMLLLCGGGGFCCAQLILGFLQAGIERLYPVR